MSRQVLVIEDDDDIAQLVKLQLAGLSCDVRVINDGRAGLAEALAQPYDLLVLDLMLPGVDGLEICRRLRSEQRYTPILMLTERSTELESALAVGLPNERFKRPVLLLDRPAVVVRRVEAFHRVPDRPVQQVRRCRVRL